MTPDDTGAHEFVDHMTCGRQAADKLGLIGDEFVWAASLGRDAQGRGQVLVLRGQSVLRAPTDGGNDLVEMHRTHIRSVEAAPGQGLLLRARAAMAPPFGRRGRVLPSRPVHRVPPDLADRKGRRLHS